MFFSSVGFHICLELAGQLILVLAYRHICRRSWHRLAIWIVGTVALAFLTVWLVG